jgi:two-component system cell cycle sensor histidine kinase/response regulator CckA
MEMDDTRHASTDGLDSKSRETRLQAAQIQQIYDHARIGMIGAAVAPLILVGVMWNVVSYRILIVWLAVFIAVQALRHVSASVFRKDSPTGGAVIPWGRRFAVGSAITALLWGLVPILLFPADSLLHQFFLAAFMAGVAASSAVAHASLTNCYLPSILLILAPLSCRYIYEGGQVPVAIGIGVVVFALALVGTARATHNSLLESL